MLLFTDRMKIVDEYCAWVQEANKTINGGELDATNPMNVLAFLQEKGYLNEKQNEPQEEKPNKSDFVLFEGIFGERILIKKGMVQCIEEYVSIPTCEKHARIVYNVGDLGRSVPVSCTFEEVMKKLGLSKENICKPLS